MDDYKHVELGLRILPGVDLALWLRIVTAVVLAAVALGIGLAAF
jgi:hypothetical protein